jgi:FkbM family methyltransferase
MLRGWTISRRLPRAVGGGKIYVAPGSQLSFLRPQPFDPSLIDWARRYAARGRVVWDIGANVGVFAFSASGMGSEVWAVEPDPFLANMLLRSARQRPNFHVVTAAISDRSRIARLEISSGGRAGNALAEHANSTVSFGRSIDEVVVPAIALDDLLEAASRPYLVKIHIEGAELAALSGAGKLLHEVRPILIVEVGSERGRTIGELLRRSGYRMRDALEPDGPEIAEPSFNTLCLPE